MKVTLSLLLLIVPCGSGCLELPKIGGKAKAKSDSCKAGSPVARPEGASASRAKPVTAERITEGNAQERGNALDEEIARDEQELLQTAESAPTPPKKH